MLKFLLKFIKVYLLMHSMDFVDALPSVRYWSKILYHIISTPSSTVRPPAPIAQLVECPLRGPGGHGFDPGPRHTKVVKNGTSCSSLGTQTYGVELGLVNPVSGLCDWVWYHVKCLGHDTSVRQHYKSEH